ncbi:MAG: FliA/WhiG family RNA polymerase sigma factor [Candidatus Omnitrophica bacterium]|nr:FliA/WhiG family RNA polymerase sigma factor [Candidatus Omnitrophota bacterium]MCM8769328.1 FliA/WhiG family RNA polymerase sigma factor [Candidatus Omnitrophota bacterium]
MERSQEAAGRVINKHWRRFKRTGNIQSRNFLLVHYLPLASYVASTIPVFQSRVYSHDDLVNWAVLGLIDALRLFNPDRGIKFETYAISRIRGEIMDNLRRLTSCYRLRKQKIFENLFNQLSEKLSRPPTPQEMARALGVDSKGYLRWLAYALPVSIISLDEFASMEGKFQSVNSPGTRNFPLFTNGEREKVAEDLAKAIQRLPERERYLITLYYYEGLTLTEIAKIMNLTKGRVSQIHAHAIISLRQALGLKTKPEGEKNR